MSKSSRQKMKLIFLRDYLLKNTDENHSVTVKDIITYLEGCGIPAERKSIYDDIAVLKDSGVDIVSEKSERTVWYKIVSRDFEVSELKLLVDAVQSSRFITEKKSSQLIKKIESLCSRYEAYELDRQLTVVNRIKSMNESIYYNVDKIHAAIRDNRMISFRYFDYNVKKEKVFRHGGELYKVSPFALNWDNENYYLVAYDSAAEQIRHYRVDKMDSLSEIDGKARQGAESFEKIDMSAYSKKIFSMFGGESVKVRLEFANELAGVVIDRFGKDIYITVSDNPDYFNFETEIALSPNFYGWLFSFGEKARIVNPQRVKDDFLEFAKKVIDKYN